MATRHKQVPRVAVTMGDPAGIGPELCLRILEDASILAECVPVVFGDAGILSRVAKCCHLPEPSQCTTRAQWEKDHELSRSTVVDCRAVDASAVRPGEVDEACGRAASTYIEASVQAALAGEVAAIATAPIHKEALQLAKVPYPGHTEFLAALTGAKRVCMMLVSDEMIVSFVTTHIGYAEVPRKLTSARIREVIELTAEAVVRLRGKVAKIAVCGLNPHAGEGGLFGFQEEQRLIEPAIEEARAKGIEVVGPLPPDAAFLPERRRQWDALVCMYHDQGHIPFKMLAFDKGVNITLGLPIIRTSVDHGTAFDIAWTGRARPESMVQAVLWAAKLAKCRGEPVARPNHCR
ncbi:4-hydroxythreonine-4-phosphate dehydrogenase PdxA [Acidobacteria bacterium AH-259-O06]|nr:4-hydroxythreonine-4-phosphate dehydrogenase PdxA [Acidobacteria bacterium AH-259-O06]